MPQSNKIVTQIARLMCETEPVMAPSQLSQPLMTFNQIPGGSESRYENNNDDEFSEDELRVAKQFIEMIGCPDRARDLLDQAIECGDCLGIVGDDSEAETIEAMAMIIPSTPDMPTNGNMASQFNPGQF